MRRLLYPLRRLRRIRKRISFRKLRRHKRKIGGFPLSAFGKSSQTGVGAEAETEAEAEAEVEVEVEVEVETETEAETETETE